MCHITTYATLPQMSHHHICHITVYNIPCTTLPYCHIIYNYLHLQQYIHPYTTLLNYYITTLSHFYSITFKPTTLSHKVLSCIIVYLSTTVSHYTFMYINYISIYKPCSVSIVAIVSMQGVTQVRLSVF